MICTYLPRVAVHGDRYGSARPMPPKWIVLHTSEQTGETTSSAANLASFMTTPGDRPSSNGGRYGSSYHAVLDLGMKVRPAVHDGFVSFSAPGANTEGLHVCFPGKARQTRAEWLDDYSRDLIRTCAGLITDYSSLYGIPPVRLSVAELRAGTRGYTDHAGIRDAFGRTTHYDVGPGFPWDILDADIKSLYPTTPKGQIDMFAIDYYSPSWVAFTVTGSDLRWVADGHADSVLRRAGVKRERVNRDELAGLIRSYKTAGPCPAELDADLRALWVGTAQ